MPPASVGRPGPARRGKAEAARRTSSRWLQCSSSPDKADVSASARRTASTALRSRTITTQAAPEPAQRELHR